MFFTMFIKELKDSFRDRRTLLLTVVLPLIMMSALVFYYESLISDSSDSETINLAVNVNMDSQLKELFSSNNFNVIESSNPESLLKDGEVQAGVMSESQFVEKINSHKQPSITVMLRDEFSQDSSVSTIVMSALQQYKQSIVNERLLNANLEREMINPFQIEQTEISETNAGMALLGTLIPLILVLAIGIGAGPSAADLFAGEKEKKTMEALLMTPVNRFTIIMSKWLTISAIGSISGVVTLIVVALEIQFMTEHLKDALSNTANIGLIVVIITAITIIYAMFVASILMVTSIMAKTIKESQSYSTPIMMLAIFPVMVLTSVGVNELEFHHFAIPMFNIFSSLKELLLGTIDWEHIVITLGSNIIAILIIFGVGRMMFLKDKWVMN